MLLALAVTILVFWALGDRYMKGERVNLLFVFAIVIAAASYFYGRK